MIYFENCAKGAEGFNTHVIAYTFCISLSNFLDREFYFDYEYPSSTPPAFASEAGFSERYGIVLSDRRSLVSDLLVIPTRRVTEINRTIHNKIELKHTHSYFGTTDELRQKYGGTMIFEHFGMGRTALTREELNGFDLVEWIDTRLSNPSYFYFLSRSDKRALLRTVDLHFLPEIEELAATIVREAGHFDAVHIRLGDFASRRPEFSPLALRTEFAEYIRRVFSGDRPVLIATDGLDEKELFGELFTGIEYRFIDEIIFDRYRGEFMKLPFSDFNVLTVLNQLVCAASDTFAGTYISTFTGVIHKLRQERYGKRDFMFFPDPLVSRHLGDDLRLVPDRQGFFDWNRFSAFAPTHFQMAWAREWDFDLTAVDLETDQEFGPGSNS